jgi:hypothetical protein
MEQRVFPRSNGVLLNSEAFALLPQSSCMSSDQSSKRTEYRYHDGDKVGREIDALSQVFEYRNLRLLVGSFDGTGGQTLDHILCVCQSVMAIGFLTANDPFMSQYLR